MNKEDKWYKLIYRGTIYTERKIRLYRKLLKSDKYFTMADYAYFGREIYRYRVFRKECAVKLAFQTIKFWSQLYFKIKLFFNTQNK